MNTYYQQFDKAGRMFLDSEPPKDSSNLISAIRAESWMDARDELLSDPELDGRYVEGFTYKYGHGYFK